MKGILDFGKKEKGFLAAALLCFIAGAAILVLGREWTIAGIALMLVNGVLLIRVMMIQADCIERLVKDKEDYMQQQRKERLNERVSYLKEEIQETHRKIEEQRETQQ